jgi:hypothetical protein
MCNKRTLGMHLCCVKNEDYEALPHVRRKLPHHIGVHLPLEVALPDAGKTRIFVKGGFAEVDADHLTVLAERALPVEEMDATTIAAELGAAEAELAAASDDTARLAAASAVERLRSLRG